MEGRLAARDQMYDPWSHSDEEDNERSQSQLYLADMSHEPSTQAAEQQQQSLQHQLLFEALAKLDDRSKDIIQRRWINDEKVTFKELAEEYGVSIERIRQIEAAAFKKMKGKLTAIM